MSSEWPPARPGPSIYQYVRDHLTPDGSLAPDGESLPDEAAVTAGGLRWMPGARDGVFGHHGGRAGQDRARAAADLLVAAAGEPSERNLGRLYDACCDDDVLWVVDHVIELVAESGANAGVVHQVGRWLATTAVGRGPVKVGLALLGVTGLGADADVARILGRHEEFTLYAAVALANGTQAPEAELWALGRAVRGWGRIQCVERLAGTDDPVIREWILREGFRNSVMYEYLAYIAATTGGLNDALRRPDVERPVLTAAGEILAALVAGGPAQNMDDYEAGADAVEAYLALMTVRAESLRDYLAVAAIRRFLDQAEGWEERGRRGWSATRREAFESHCAAILSGPEWENRIRVALLSDDPAEFGQADTVARERGIDTFDAHVSKIRQDPLGSSWFRAWQQADRGRAELLASLARELLPLPEIASGPAREHGMGPEWKPHVALDWTLQALRDHPGVGADLVLTGLRSPVIRNRNMSLNALKAWPPDVWPEGARELARHIVDGDPEERVREFASKILRSTRW